MPKKFPLQSVLEHRLRLEEQRQMTVALAEIRREQARSVLQLAINRRDTVMADLEALKTSNEVDGRSIISAHQQFERATTAVLQAQDGLRGAEAAIEEAKSAALTASQDRVVVEKLRENFHYTTRKHSDHVEAERLGELSLNRWHSQRGEA